LNALITKVTVRTVVRVQASGIELFLLNNKFAPDVLRIGLSRRLGLIRNARPDLSSANDSQPPSPSSIVDQLVQLAPCSTPAS